MVRPRSSVRGDTDDEHYPRSHTRGPPRAPAEAASLLRRFTLSTFLATLAAGTGLAASGTQSYEERPYGRAWPSEPAAAPTLVLDGSSLVLAGGAPGDLAIVLCGERRSNRPLPTGGAIVVEGSLERAVGYLDRDGRFQLDLDSSFPADRALHLQGFVQHAGALSLTRGLCVERVAGEEPEVGEPGAEAPAFDPWQSHFPPLAVDSVLAALGERDLGEALVAMLNSAGDELELELEGEISVGEGACAGGQAKLALELECAEAGVYDLLLGGDVSFLAGVELVEGIETKGTVGVGADHLWRFHSQDELEYGVAAFAVMQAMGPRAEIAAEGAYQAVTLAQDALAAANELVDVRAAALAVADRARETSERAWQHAPYWLRNARHAALASLRAWVESLRHLVQSAESARAFVQQTAQAARAACDAAFTALTWVHDSRVFLDEHVHGIELRFAKGVEIELSASPIPGVDLANLGAGLDFDLERTVHVRWTGPFFTDEETVAVSFTCKRETELDLGKGYGLGVDVENELAIEKRFRRAGNRFVGEPATARFVLDVAANGELGVLVTAQGGAGRELSIELDAAELKRVGKDGVTALLDGDPSAVAHALTGTRARFSVDDRYFAGLALDFGISAAGNGFSIEGKLRWNDHGVAGEEELPIAEGLNRLFGRHALDSAIGLTRAAAEEVGHAIETASAAL